MLPITFRLSCARFASLMYWFTSWREGKTDDSNSNRSFSVLRSSVVRPFLNLDVWFRHWRRSMERFSSSSIGKEKENWTVEPHPMDLRGAAANIWQYVGTEGRQYHAIEIYLIHLPSAGIAEKRPKKSNHRAGCSRRTSSFAAKPASCLIFRSRNSWASGNSEQYFA